MFNDNTLTRFTQAQQPLYPQVLKELHNGKKTTHWMWFIFPQIEGLGYSSTAKYYSIKSIEEAKEYIASNFRSKIIGMFKHHFKY